MTADTPREPVTTRVRFRRWAFDEAGVREGSAWAEEWDRLFHAALVDASAFAGHRTIEPHDCFLMDCHGLGKEVDRLRVLVGGIDADRLAEVLYRQPEATPEPIGRVRRKWWRLGWLSAMAVARSSLGVRVPASPYGLLSPEEQAQLADTLAEGHRTRRRGAASASQITLAAPAEPAP